MSRLLGSARLTVVVALAASLSFTAFAGAAERMGDWPQILGPQRDGVSTGPAIRTNWQAAPPKSLWSHEVGEGYSGPAIAEGGLIVFHRVGDEEIVERLDAATGRPIWKSAGKTSYRDAFGFDNGPRATPTIHEDRVYFFGAEGTLTCLEFATGKVLWTKPLAAQFQAEPGFFGFACSPLVEDGRVLLNLGGKNRAGIVAVDAKSGEILWKNVDDEASYSSPVLASINGRRHGVFFTRTGLVDVDPASGAVLHQQRWRARIAASVNAANPIVVGDEIFLSACYNVGATVVRVEGDKLVSLWANDESMSNHFATCVHRNGYLYGLHGRQEEGPTLRCVEWKTGKVMWSDAGGKGGSVLLAGEVLLVLHDDGVLRAVKAAPDSYQPIDETKPLDGLCRALPALAQGVFYARDDKKLTAVDLRRP